LGIELPKISVITVCLNAAPVINATICSVLNQTYRNIEYIIIDGGSTDGTIAVLNNYKQQNRLSYISEPDNGIYEAMNKGIKNASGELVMFLNAGDAYLTPHVLEEVVSKMKTNRADMFFGRILWVDVVNNTTVLSDHDMNKYASDLKRSNFPHPSTIYKKNLFKQIGLFDETFKIIGDYEWNARALLKYSISFQYLNIAIARFTTDGVSNDPTNAERIMYETNEIQQRYYKPVRILILIERLAGRRLKNQFLARFGNKKLNRVY